MSELEPKGSDAIERANAESVPASADHLRRELAQHLKALRVVEGGKRVNGKGGD